MLLCALRVPLVSGSHHAVDDTPLQVVSDDIGEKSMMTYLSQFAGAKKPVVEPKKVGGLRGTLSRAFTKKKSSAVPAEEPKKEPEAPVIVFEAPVHPEFLAKVEDLFYAMDVDQNGRVTKIELVEFLREYKPKDTTVAKIQVGLQCCFAPCQMILPNLSVKCESHPAD